MSRENVIRLAVRTICLTALVVVPLRTWYTWQGPRDNGHALMGLGMILFYALVGLLWSARETETEENDR